MTRKILSSKNITWSEAKEILQKRKQESSGGILVTQERAWEYLKTFAVLDAETARKLVNELVNEASIDEDLAVVVANMCPSTKGEIRSILEMKKEIQYNEEVVNKVKSIVDKYCQPTIEE
ncbi:MAG: hypothetical protein F7C36_00295 [Desulfurococcales archaeon]|nr:hypothetical protein [Desulfurococcales archaeon]